MGRTESGGRHRIVILIVGSLVVALMIFGGMLRPMLRRAKAADLKGAQPRHGIATVTARFGATQVIGATKKRQWAQVRFQGKLYGSDRARRIEALRDGEPARITYRIGKSGRIYVDLVEPLMPSE